MSVTVKKILLICPECNESINCGLDDVEFSLVAGEMLINFECPTCGALVEEEPVLPYSDSIH